MALLRKLVVAATLAFSALSCSSGGGGDLDNITPHPVVLGTPLANANNPKAPLASGTTLNARGVVVVAVDDYDETKDGKSIGNVYVQDPVQPTDWSGMILFQSTRNPADLVLMPGNGVDVVGPYQPFAGPASGPFSDGILLPEVTKGAITLVYEGTPPTPVDITLADLKVAKDGMKYVGRLVRMADVTVQADWDPKYREASISTDKTVVLGAQFFGVDDASRGIVKGTKLKSVVGVLNYFYSFKLCPRTPDDIVR